MADWLQHKYGAKIVLVEVNADARAQGFERVSTTDLKAARFELYYLNNPLNPKSSFYRDVQRVYYVPQIEDPEFCGSSLVVLSKRIDIVEIPAEHSGPLSNPLWIPVPTSILPSVLQSARFELQYFKDPTDPEFTFCKGTTTFTPQGAPRKKPGINGPSLDQASANGTPKPYDKEPGFSEANGRPKASIPNIAQDNATYRTLGGDESGNPVTYGLTDVAYSETGTRTPKPRYLLEPNPYRPLYSNSQQKYMPSNITPWRGSISTDPIGYSLRLPALDSSRSRSFYTQLFNKNMGMGYFAPTNMAGTALRKNEQEVIPYQPVKKPLIQGNMVIRNLSTTLHKLFPKDPMKPTKFLVAKTRNRAGKDRFGIHWRDIKPHYGQFQPEPYNAYQKMVLFRKSFRPVLERMFSSLSPGDIIKGAQKAIECLSPLERRIFDEAVWNVERQRAEYVDLVDSWHYRRVARHRRAEAIFEAKQRLARGRCLGTEAKAALVYFNSSDSGLIVHDQVRR